MASTVSAPSQERFASDADARPRRVPRVVIAGLGLITPLGHGAWPTFAALLRGRRLTDRIAQLEPGTGAVPLVQAVGGVSIARHTSSDPAVELAERAAREAAAEAGQPLIGQPTWLGTSKGAVGVLDAAVAAWASGVKPLPPSGLEVVTLGPHGYLSHQLTRRTGVTVRRHTVAACASSLTALHQARLGLLNPRPDLHELNSDTALVVTAEAALLPAFIHSYRRLGVLAPLTLDGYRGRPLGDDRRGFVLAEVGAAVLLRRLASGEQPRGHDVELLDTAVATEAEDLIRPSGSMHALRHVGERLCEGRRLAALHPHAPGTAEHDDREWAVLREVTAGGGGPVPPAYANKGALGHSLGSAGLVSLVLACLAIRTGKLPPMPWLADTAAPPDNGRQHDASAPVAVIPGPHAVFAAGFGGHVAGAVVGPADDK